MNNVRPHAMLGPNGVAFPPSSASSSTGGAINGFGAMGGMAGIGGLGSMGNGGNVGAMALGNVGVGGMGGMVAGQQHQHQQHQLHPGQHAGQPPAGLLQNHQHQHQQHPNPPPMGGLHMGANPAQNQNHGAPVQGGQSQGPQTPGAIAYMQQQQQQQQQQQLRDQQLRQQIERQRLQQQQQAQQSQQQQQHQHPAQNQQGFPPGMSPMANFGSPSMANLAHTGNAANGMGGMQGLGGMSGMGAQGGIGGVPNGQNVPGFQNIPPSAAMAQLQQGMAMRRVPSQTGQPGQPQQPGGGVGMNMGILSGMNAGGMNAGGMGGVGMGMSPTLSTLRQGGIPGAQRGPPYQAQQPGQVGHGQGQPRSVSGLGGLPPEVQAVMSQSQQHQQQSQQLQHQQQQQRELQLQHQHQQQQHGLPNQHPRTPGIQHANPVLPPNVNSAVINGGPVPNPMNPNPTTPGLQRTPSAQSMNAPGLVPGGLHHQSHLGHANPGHPQQHSLGHQIPNPPPFTNPLHHAQLQHQHQQQQQQQQQHQHQLSGGQQHHPGQHPHQQPSGIPGVPMPGMPGVHHIPGAGPQQNAIPGGMQGHAGQQQHPNAGSPPRSGTGGHSQPQTPALPMTARPQSRAEQTAMLGFQGGVGQPPFGANMRQPVQHQPGQPGQMGHPYGVPGMGMAVGGRATPQQHSQSPMAALGSSPGGPVSGRPGSSAGPGGPGGVAGGLGTPNVVGQTGRAGPVPPGVTVPGLQSAGPFPTPAQQFEAQEAARASYMARMAQQNAQGAGSLGTPQRPASQAATHPHQGQPQYPSPMQSLVAQRTGSPAVHRQGTPLQQQQQPGPLIGTPTLAHAHHMGMAQPAPGPGPGVGPQQQQHPQQHAPQNRPPSRQVRTPSRQQNQPQAGPSRTPRMQQAALPATPGAGPSTGGGPPPLGLAMRPGVGLGVHPMQGPQPAPGQPQQPQQPQPPPSAGQQQQSLAHQQQNNAAAVLQQRPSPQDGANPAPMLNMPPFSGFGPRQPIYPVQQQAGLGRLLSFSDTLSQPRLPLSKEYWEGMVQDYFSPKAVVKITLWKDNAQQEAKPFDIGMPILPRFFLVTSQSGVNSMSINLENAKERGVPGNPYGSVVECPNAVWTFRYANGYIVTLRGPLTAYLAAHPNTMPQSAQPGVNGAPQAQGQFSYKIDNITFNSKMHEKALRVDAIEGKRGDPVQRTPKMKAEPSPGPSVSTLGSPPMDEERANGELVMHIEKATIPVEPVNAFGIPQATMRCLELAESVGQMSDLIEYSLKTNSGPLDALKNFARYIREQSHMLPPQNQNSPSHMMDAHLTNGVAASPAVTLYQSSPPMEPATTNSGGLQPPQNMAHRAAQNAAQGQGDTASPNMASTPSAQTPSAPPLSAGPTTSTSSTPMLAHANLKRKAGDTSSPTTAPSEQQPPPAKRAQRKRSVRHAGS